MVLIFPSFSYYLTSFGRRTTKTRFAWIAEAVLNLIDCSFTLLVRLLACCQITDQAQGKIQHFSLLTYSCAISNDQAGEDFRIIDPKNERIDVF